MEINKNIAAILLVLSLSGNLYQAVVSSDIAKELAKKDVAMNVVTNNYYSLLNFSRTKIDAIKNESRKRGFFSQLFSDDTPEVGDLDLDKYDDPFDEREIEDR